MLEQTLTFLSVINELTVEDKQENKVTHFKIVVIIVALQSYWTIQGQ